MKHNERMFKIWIKYKKLSAHKSAHTHYISRAKMHYITNSLRNVSYQKYKKGLQKYTKKTLHSFMPKLLHSTCPLFKLHAKMSCSNKRHSCQICIIKLPHSIKKCVQNLSTKLTVPKKKEPEPCYKLAYLIPIIFNPAPKLPTPVSQ